MNDTKKDESLSKRLNEAYKRLPTGYLRKQARELFCKTHHCSGNTFRQKRTGKSSVTVLECEWLEKHDPYAQLVTA